MEGFLLSEQVIIFVPGKNPKPEPINHLSLLERCLLQGVENIDPAVAQQMRESSSLRLCAWNHDFYHQYEEISDQAQWLDIMLSKHQANLKDKLASSSLKIKFERLLYLVGGYLPKLAKLFAPAAMKAMEEGTLAYFENHDNVAQKIRDKLKVQLLAAAEAEQRVLLIGHSMGSIIAYDTLLELMHDSGHRKLVDLFLTLGSPLGMDYVQQRLLSYDALDLNSFPDNIKHWKNIAAVGDRVSVENTLADDFAPMLEGNLIETIEDYNHNVTNWFYNDEGYNFHRSYAYLVNPIVAKIIKEWW